MQTTSNNWIKSINYSELVNWSTSFILGSHIDYSNNFGKIRIKEFLKRNKLSVSIKDDELYKRPTVKMNAKGVYLRDEVMGTEIGTKKQFRVRKGQFLLSKIDARNGAFGLVPEELDNCVITGNFWTFDVDYSKVNPNYLVLLAGTCEFQKLCQTASVGTTNRNYLQENLFLNFSIPLPSIEVQGEILCVFYEKISKADRQKIKIQNIETKIENLIIKELGLVLPPKRIIKNGLQFFNFKNLYRWDALSNNTIIQKHLLNSKYTLKSLGSVFHFTTRSWQKQNHPNTKINYIEIGAIDPVLGVLDVIPIDSNDAPSRATQTVKKGDLIIGTTRPYLKKFTLIPSEFDGDVCSSGFSVIENSVDYDLFFLKEFLVSYFGIEQMKNRMTGGSYPAIALTELKEIKIPLPPLKIQNLIGNKIKTLRSKMISLINNSAENRKEAIREFEQIIFKN